MNYFNEFKKIVNIPIEEYDDNYKFETSRIKSLEKNDIPKDTRYMFINSYNRYIRLDKNNLPKSLEYLFIYNLLDIEENILPKNLKILVIMNVKKYYKRQEFRINKNILPESLEELYIINNFNTFIEKDVLPKNLKVLSLGNDYNKTLENLPLGLEVLCVDNKIKINQELPNLKFLITHLINNSSKIPENLEALYIKMSTPETQELIQQTKITNLFVEKYENNHLEFLPERLRNLYLFGYEDKKSFINEKIKPNLPINCKLKIFDSDYNILP